MKKIIYILFVTLTLFSCDRDPDKNIDSNKLPEATQNGERTAGCIVNGKIWVASKKWLDGNRDFITWCEKNSNNWYSINIGLRQLNNPKSELNISFVMQNLELNKEYTFPTDSLNSTESNFCYFVFDRNSKPYYTNYPDHTGKIKISRLDIQNQIVSGTFEFEAKNENGEKLIVKEGRFDKKFD